MARYQFVSDTYRLFSALNRLCDSKNQWFNSSPTQKYVLRQLKAVDSGLAKHNSNSPFLQGYNTHSAKEGKEDSIEVLDMNVSLLMLYGHILYAGKSFSYAISKSFIVFTISTNS